MTQSCESCHNQYKGADEVLRCRVHHNGLKCSPEAADGCEKYERYAGAEPWFDDAWRCDAEGRN